MNAHRVQVYFQPPPAAAVGGGILVVVDTLRATTVITTLLAGGASAVYPCAGADEARALAARLPGSRLTGERHGVPIEGFEFGNSAAEFARLNVQGWTLVQATSNGTRTLALTAQAARTLIGCLRNRAAVAARAPAEGRTGGQEIAIVCAGEENAVAPSVEDAFTAGAIVERMIATDPTLTLAAGARLARRLYHAYHGDPLLAFAESPHAAELRRLGYADDLLFAAAMDVESCVPTAVIDETGRVVVRV